MSGRLTKARSLLALGATNLARVGWYRGRLRLGVHPVQRISGKVAQGRLFEPVNVAPRDAPPSGDWTKIGHLFGWYDIAANQPPGWATDAMTGEVRAGGDAPWWTLPDFAGGDIKTIWEPSRLNWLIPFAQRARNGEPAELDRLEQWMRDWIDANPPYLGHNWKCAQEASIRVLHLAEAACILDQDRVLSDALRDLLHVHLQRILPTLDYAAAQENNHATSEAAALYVGGSWLEACGDPRGARSAALGRVHLERSVQRLFAPDGSFSQYSVTYHRLALDTISLAEVWRRRHDDAPFGKAFLDRAAAVAEWLRHMIDVRSGDAPNLGWNDGADLLQLGASYRDFRPSVQLATVLFGGRRAFAEGRWDDACTWLGIDLPVAIAPPPRSRRFDDGGYAVLRAAEAMAVMRYPRFRFRPNNADPLHVDLWVDGCNVLRDGGTFSYNADAATIDYFNGIESHNTVQFDGASPMPRVGRFLFGDWLRTEEASEIEDNRFAASYRDRSGRRHRRRLAMTEDRLTVIDEIAGFERNAVLRWRLAPGDWRLAGSTVTNGKYSIAVTGPQALTARLVTGRESRHYLHQSDVPVFEVEVEEAGILTTEISWRS
jgi:hypothetical protein